tara:strand:- start:355 stop:492 length:138 start_codon:yes stop_codon:yes gene_type:complete
MPLKRVWKVSLPFIPSLYSNWGLYTYTRLEVDLKKEALPTNKKRL